jgi:hypothetical protein
MNDNDAQAWRDTRYFTSRLLLHFGVLPPDLTMMLQEFESELASASPGRWDGIGNPAQHDDLAGRISQQITDGEWSPGTCLDWSRDKRYCWAETRENVMSALQLLAVRGELALKRGNYYVKARNENS